MSSKDKNKIDTRPAYTPPRVIRLDEVNTGAGARCAVGASPSSGTCLPTGNGASVQSCGRGNGAKAGCFFGNGVG